MLKFGIKLLFITFAQFIITYFACDFLYTYKKATGSIGILSGIELIPSYIWIVFLIELSISLAYVHKGIKLNKYE